MKIDYDRRIARAEDLASRHPESAEILNFYSALARMQRDIFEEVSRTPAQDAPTDLAPFIRYFPRLIELVERAGPAPLAEFARQNLSDVRTQEEVLTGQWLGGTEIPEADFFARVLLQPFAESRAAHAMIGDQSVDQAIDQVRESTCPFCKAKPGLAVLRGEGDGAARSLICAVCSTEWPYRRVVCPNCGEENKDQLPVFVPAQTGYVRVDACDTCHRYLKSIDLTKDGHAVPIVDELATVALNIWAEERGYVKIETNLLGM